MGRKAHANYIDAALEILQELGGGPISTKTLVAAAQERGLVGDGTWVYHNFSRKVRESNLFDTSVRGQITLIQNAEPVAEVEMPAAPVEEAPMPEPEVEPQPEPQTFPGPTLGGSSFGS